MSLSMMASALASDPPNACFGFVAQLDERDGLCVITASKDISIDCHDCWPFSVGSPS